MEQLRTLLLKAFLLLVIATNSACQQNPPKITATQWKTYNLRILRKIVNKECNRRHELHLKHPGMPDYIVLKEMPLKKELIKQRSSDFPALYREWSKNVSIKLPRLFSDENVAYYLKQLKQTQDLSYIDKLKDYKCVLKELPKGHRFTVPSDPRFYWISKVLFTKNSKYAFCLEANEGVFLSIYKNVKGIFVYYCSMSLGVY